MREAQIKVGPEESDRGELKIEGLTPAEVPYLLSAASQGSEESESLSVVKGKKSVENPVIALYSAKLEGRSSWLMETLRQLLNLQFQITRFPDHTSDEG